MRIVMIVFSNVEYTIELTEALSEIEDVLLMMPDKAIKWFGYEKVIDPKVNLYGFYYPRMRYPSNALMIYQIIKKINEFKPDIIHLQVGHPWFNLALPLLKQYCLVTTMHDVIKHSGDKDSHRIPAFTYKPPIKYASQLIVHGNKLKVEMIREYRRSADDIHVLPRGVNSICRRFTERAVEEERHTIMFFGRIWGYKGIKYLIEAEPLITEKVPDLKIIIAGEGEDFQKYRDMMVHEDKFIVYNKFIPYNMASELLQKTGIMVLPYIDGSQSAAIPLAYAFKKPVVITDVGSLPENVDQGVTGYIVPPKDSKKLAEAVIDLLTDDEKRRRMGENGYKKTQGDLSWKNIAPRTIEVYKRALAVKNRSIQKN